MSGSTPPSVATQACEPAESIAGDSKDSGVGEAGRAAGEPSAVAVLPLHPNRRLQWRRPGRGPPHCPSLDHRAGRCRRNGCPVRARTTGARTTDATPETGLPSRHNGLHRHLKGGRRAAREEPATECWTVVRERFSSPFPCRAHPSEGEEVRRGRRRSPMWRRVRVTAVVALHE